MKGFELVWVSPAEAASLLEGGVKNAKGIEGSSYIGPRDVAILKAAESYLT